LLIGYYFIGEFLPSLALLYIHEKLPAIPLKTYGELERLIKQIKEESNSRMLGI
jgi:hypothetical protein